MDANGDGTLDLDELSTALDLVGLKIPMYKVRKIQEELHNATDVNQDGKIDMQEFKSVSNNYSRKAIFKPVVKGHFGGGVRCCLVKPPTGKGRDFNLP